jgi:phytanoyl-CoA hydroxylase
MSFRFWPFTRREEPAAVSAGNPEIAALRASWEQDGYLILPAFYGRTELEAAEQSLRDAWKADAPRIVVDDLVSHRRMRLADVDEHARRTHRFKVNDLYLEHDAVRKLALNARISPILSSLLGETPVLCNSLSFEQGSGQPDHVDSLYMTPRTPKHLIAIWVALENCGLDAGPLRYFRGSHKIPEYVFSDGTHHAIDAEMDAWNEYIAREVKWRGLVPEVFAAKQGDVFIWSASLLHGGSPIDDPSKTRRSIVFHYHSEQDSIANGSTLVPFEGGFWLHRRHQPVPGLGESDAPPLPANARVHARPNA